MSLWPENQEKRPPEPVYPQDVQRPASRAFHMAMTPFPYDWNEEAFAQTYRIVHAHTDLISQHLDEGIPWPEAASGEPFHEKAQERLDRRIEGSRGRKVFLSVTPLSSERDDLARYWGKKSHAKLPKKWKKRRFDDPDVIDAYLNFCRRMIEAFRPAYFAYAIEANMLAENDPERWPEFLRLMDRVYHTLKREYPGLPVMATIQADYVYKNPGPQRAAVREMLRNSDFVAVSSYPFIDSITGQALRVRNLPPDWFARLRNLAPEKPFAVAETGYLAEDFKSYAASMRIPGTERDQADYMKWLLNEANTLDAEFIVWFVARDYDELWGKARLFMPEFFKLWRDTGLQDEEGRARVALKTWDAWLAAPVRK